MTQRLKKKVLYDQGWADAKAGLATDAFYNRPAKQICGTNRAMYEMGYRDYKDLKRKGRVD